jgi:hypothetical protein
MKNFNYLKYKESRHLSNIKNVKVLSGVIPLHERPASHFYLNACGVGRLYVRLNKDNNE